MVPILAALLSGVTCLLTARIFRSGEWAPGTAAAIAALVAGVLPNLHGPNMSAIEIVATDLSRAAMAALVGCLLGTTAILAAWAYSRTEP